MRDNDMKNFIKNYHSWLLCMVLLTSKWLGIYSTANKR